MAVVTVFLLASSQAQGKYKFAFMEEFVTTVLAPVQNVASNVAFSFRKVGLSTSELML
jgi:rod shape-determining protein MreC